MRRFVFPRSIIAALLLALVLGLPSLTRGEAEHAARGDDRAEDDHAKDEHAHEESIFTVEEFERHGVKVAIAAAGEVDVGVELPGEVRPDALRLAHIAPLFPGIAREVRKGIGDQVEAGEVLALIQSERLATYELRTALAGTVLDRHINPGEVVRQEDAAFIVADLETVWVEVAIYQKALDNVRVGQPVEIAALQGSLRTTGAVSYISPVVDQATRTATARVVLANPDGLWRPGLFVTATVYDPVRADVVVPRRAVRTLEGKDVVFVVEGGKFTPRIVRVGRVGRTRVEIAGGLVAGEQYADEGSFRVKAELAKSSGEHAH
jgi:cobalt-zinc-cadmium efflux system membrane fusion protein